MAKNTALSLRVQWLGERLRKARIQAGCTLEDSGEYLQVRHTTLSRIENGIYRARPSYVRDLIDFYGISDERERAVLLQLNEDAWRKDWWIKDSSGLDAEFIDYTWLEARAARICVFEPMLIHGLLQTADYAKALTIAGMPEDTTPETIDRMVELRLHRQRILTGTNATKLSIVFEEAPLYRNIGGKTTHVAQLHHLLGQSGHENIDIRILPRTSGWHHGLDGPFTVINMPDPYPDVAYIENLAGRSFLEDDAKVDRFRQAYDGLYKSALSPAQSHEFISNLLKGLE